MKRKQPFKWVTEEIGVELDKLKLDTNNVRFQHLNKEITEKEMEDLIWREKATRSLYSQIVAAQKLFDEPIIDYNNVVREGNRRIVCLRHIQKDILSGKLSQLTRDIFETIVCKRIPKGTPEDQVLIYLATIHVKGKLAWPAFNKAKKIYELNLIYNYSFDQITKMLGMSKKTVKKMIDAYNLTDKYGKKYPEEKEWYERYTYFNEFLTKRELKDYTKDQEMIDKFSRWVHENKLEDSRNVRYLPQILANDNTLRIFELYGFTEASHLIQELNPDLRSKEFKQIRKTIEVLQRFSRKELIRTAKDPVRLRMLEKLKKEVETLLKDLESLERAKEE